MPMYYSTRYMDMDNYSRVVSYHYAIRAAPGPAATGYVTIWPHPTSTLIRVIFLFVHSFSTTFFYVTARGLMQNITHRISHSKTYHKYFTIETMQIKICKFLFTLVYTQNQLWKFKCSKKFKSNYNWASFNRSLNFNLINSIRHT